MKVSPPEILEPCLRSGYKINSFLAIQTLPVFPVVIFSPLARPYWASRFWAVLGGQNWKSIFEKTRVGFGRTELSLRLSCIEFCALSSGQGPRGRGFEGFCKTLDFHECWGVKNGKHMKMQDEHGQILVYGALDPRKMIS